MSKRAFVKYTKKGDIVPGSLLITTGNYPTKTSLWKEVDVNFCCQTNPCTPLDYGDWTLVTGGSAGDGTALVDQNNSNKFTIIGPNDYLDEGWVYLKQYFPLGAEFDIAYSYSSFDEGEEVDRPIYFTSSEDPTGMPGDVTAKVSANPESGTWNITVPPGNWFSVGIYSTDSCCGRGFLQISINF